MKIKNDLKQGLRFRKCLFALDMLNTLTLYNYEIYLSRRKIKKCQKNILN